jgi:Ni/Fe-hydrogenase subunit HybB-like protein
MLFILVDMGQPQRVTNVFLHPTLNSVMFWDSVVLFGYLVLNLVIGAVTFDAERKEAPPPGWVKPLIILSIPWAVSIHTVTAFLYSGLEARTFWMTAILAPRFLASAYAVAINIFFVGVELFTAIYSDMPHHIHAFEYMFLGLHGHDALAPWMWTSGTISIVCVVCLLIPRIRNDLRFLGFICAGVITAIWIEKGMGMVVAGFIPSPLGEITEYLPTRPEVAITVGVYAIGFMILTMFYRIVVNVRERLETT